MSDATPTPDPDGAIYPDGTPSLSADNPGFAPDDPRRFSEPPQPPVTGESGTPRSEISQPADPPSGQVTSQVDGEMLIANLLVEVANLTRRALVAETMVQMYQRAAQPKSAQ